MIFCSPFKFPAILHFHVFFQKPKLQRLIWIYFSKSFQFTFCLVFHLYISLHRHKLKEIIFLWHFHLTQKCKTPNFKTLLFLHYLQFQDCFTLCNQSYKCFRMVCLQGLPGSRSIPTCKTTGKGGRRLTQMNKELLTKLKHKKEACKTGMQSCHPEQIHRYCLCVQRWYQKSQTPAYVK